MEERVHLTTWISRESKQRFSAVAQAQGLSGSALLRRLVEPMVAPDGSGAARERDAQEERRARTESARENSLTARQ